MATRNPTDFNVWVDHTQLLAAEQIDTTEPTQVADDQAYVLDHPELGISDQFPCQRITGTSFVEVGKYLINGCKDNAGNADNEHYVVVMAWTDGTATGEVRINDGTGAIATLSLAAADSTQIWRLISASYTGVQGGTSVSTLTLEARRVANGTAIYVAGIGLYANET